MPGQVPPRILKEKPWYATDQVSEKKPQSQWQAKRDAWEDYDSEHYRKVVENFEVAQQKKKQRVDRKESEDLNAEIIDTYSRTVARPSYRDVNDTAHYLLEGGLTDEFKESETLKDKVSSQQDAAPMTSDLKEDFYPQNHSTVYGSWFHKGKWGFRCCHQIDPKSMCTNARSDIKKDAKKGSGNELDKHGTTRSEDRHNM